MAVVTNTQPAQEQSTQYFTKDGKKGLHKVPLLVKLEEVMVASGKKQFSTGVSPR